MNESLPRIADTFLIRKNECLLGEGHFFSCAFKAGAVNENGHAKWAFVFFALTDMNALIMEGNA